MLIALKGLVQLIHVIPANDPLAIIVTVRETERQIPCSNWETACLQGSLYQCSGAGDTYRREKTETICALHIRKSFLMELLHFQRLFEISASRAVINLLLSVTFE